MSSSRALEAPIAIRHDRDDAAYLALGARFPAVGKVGRNGGDGTLIAPRWVLTAAHVARGMVRRTGGALSVYFEGDEEGYAVAQVVVHPAFTPMGPHDLALLRLERPVEHIIPVALYASRDEQEKPIVLVGHGDTKAGTGGKWVADGLRRGATNVIDQVTEEHVLFTFDAPPAGTDLEGTAGPGDSGGPAFILVDDVPYVAGISSLGQPGTNGPGTYGAREHYVRVSTYLGWIEQTMQAPPAERLVNVEGEEPGRAVVVEGPLRAGRGPGGAVLIEALGLLLIEKNPGLQMVGKVDELVPQALNASGIRPPALLQALNGVDVTSLSTFQAAIEALEVGEGFTLTFQHEGQVKEIELIKRASSR